jgi:hypothetical protein
VACRSTMVEDSCFARQVVGNYEASGVGSYLQHSAAFFEQGLLINVRICDNISMNLKYEHPLKVFIMAININKHK